METQDIERLARRRAAAKMGWYIHATVYLLVNLMLAAIAFSAGRYWSLYPAVGWGVGLAIHGAVVFLLSGNAGFYQRVLERERAALQRDPW
jgi:hypothetical protein